MMSMMSGLMGMGSMGAFDASSESALEKLRVIGSKVEDQIDILSQPPTVSAVHRPVLDRRHVLGGRVEDRDAVEGSAVVFAEAP